MLGPTSPQQSLPNLYSRPQLAGYECSAQPRPSSPYITFTHVPSWQDINAQPNLVLKLWRSPLSFQIPFLDAPSWQDINARPNLAPAIPT